MYVHELTSEHSESIKKQHIGSFIMWGCFPSTVTMKLVRVGGIRDGDDYSATREEKVLGAAKHLRL